MAPPQRVDMAHPVVAAGNIEPVANVVFSIPKVYPPVRLLNS